MSGNIQILVILVDIYCIRNKNRFFVTTCESCSAGSGMQNMNGYPLNCFCFTDKNMYKS
jgi:hypothetical protein